MPAFVLHVATVIVLLFSDRRECVLCVLRLSDAAP